MTAHREQWEARYATGSTPWDTQITPPEVEAFWVSDRLAAAGVALDIGCGPGTNVRFLGRRGLRAIGFDIAMHPLTTAAVRLVAQEPELATLCHFAQADVTVLPIAAGVANYILDVGCSHGIPAPRRREFAAGIVSALCPGGYYHLYAFDSVERQDADGQLIGYAAGEVAALFTPGLELVEATQASPDPRPCHWYLLRK
ncbi:MAG: class I SAM-dependent methyltransferase [Anaerolineales bacterium]|nr:class I SAM-dependent methyltransferase [Anaerolineales bacterium]